MPALTLQAHVLSSLITHYHRVGFTIPDQLGVRSKADSPYQLLQGFEIVQISMGLGHGCCNYLKVIDVMIVIVVRQLSKSDPP